MSTSRFDTLAIAEGLEAQGFQCEQAKAPANAIWTVRGDLVTKGDLSALESRLMNKLASRQRWCVGLPFVAAGLTVAAMKLV